MYGGRVAWLVVIQAAIAALLVASVPSYDTLAFLVGVLNRELLGHFGQIVALSFLVCIVIVLLPAVLMGMTIPVAVAALHRHRGAAAHSGTIYATRGGERGQGLVT